MDADLSVANTRVEDPVANAKQIAANRANAAKSAGPTSPSGKARASLNALRHGVRAQQVLLPGESEDELCAVREALHQDLLPKGPLQDELFEIIVDGFWRLRRCRRAEAGVFWSEIMLRRALLSALEGEGPELPGEFDPEALELGLAYKSAADSLGKLDRYESSILRRIERASRELRQLQAEEAGQVVEPDNIIDVESGPDSDEITSTCIGHDEEDS